MPKTPIAGLLLSLAAIGQAQAAAPCVTDEELNQLVLYALPDVIDGAATACKPTLGAGGFLGTDGPALIARYRTSQAAAWPVARATMTKMQGGDKPNPAMEAVVSSLPDEAVKPLFSGVVRQLVTKGIKPADCPTFDAAARLLAPLPAENMAGLVTLIVRRTDHPGPENRNRIPLCPIPPKPLATQPAAPQP